MRLPDEMLDYASEIVEQYLATTDWNQVWSYNWQSIRAFAYLYVHPKSRFKDSSKLLEQMRALWKAITSGEPYLDQRLAGHLAEAREILGAAICAEALPGLDAWLIKCGESFMREVLLPLKHVSHFVSANLATSTNHVAVFSASTFRIGQVLGRKDFVDTCRDIWDRLVLDQHPDGYWEETTGGPTTLYNNLTFCCAGRMARWTKADNYQQAALRGAKFHRRFNYPDGCNLETIDGRVRYCSYEHDMWGGFVHSDTPEGRAHMRRKMFTRMQRLPPGNFGVHAGEAAALMCENHQYWTDGAIGISECDRQNYVERLQEPGGVRKQGPWFVAMQGIKHFPLGYGFTIDRTSLISIWHQETKLIVNGSGELGENAAQTFTIKTEPHICHIPSRTVLDLGAAGSDDPMKLRAEYAGGTGRLEIRFISDGELSLVAKVDTRLDRYPVLFTLQLELREGASVNGVMLQKDKKILSDAELNGRIESGALTITFSKSGAKLVWPHDPYNPYEMVNFKSPPEKYVSLLQMPVGPEGVEVKFTVARHTSGRKTTFDLDD